MASVNPNVWQVTIPRDDLSINIENGVETVRYRYGRNDLNFITAEYLTPDTNNEFWTNLGRRITYAPGQTQHDTVERWRWLPAPGASPEAAPALLPPVAFTARADNRTFLSGQAIQDLYYPAFDRFFDSTAQHIKQQGYNVVILMPPWDWIQTDPTPKIGNPFNKNPNYPSDDKLVEHIQAFQNAGLSVILAPQVCCSEISYQHRTAQWWTAYFNEIEQFLAHFADVGQQANVSMLYYAVGVEELNAPQAAERWPTVWQTVRTQFSGQIGQMVWSFINPASPLDIIPRANDIPWGDQLDFFVLQTDAPLGSASDITDTELQQAAGRVLDTARPLFETWHKPLLLVTSYASVAGAWQGGQRFDIPTIMNAPWFGEEEWKKNSTDHYSGADQARVIDAYWRAIANRPWVIGFAQFGYWHWDMTLSPDMSVRGKATEIVWRHWNELIR